MQVDLLTLQLFVSAAEIGNMAKAAEARNIVPSAVSKRISDLEYAIKTPLLYRRPRGVELTAAGEVAYSYAKNILRLVERFEGEMSEFSLGQKGCVSIAACPSSIAQFLPADIAAYVEQNPEVSIDLNEEMSDGILRQVRDGLVDIGITPYPIEDPSLEVLTYRHDELAILAPLSHPLARFDEMSYEDTIAYRYVGLQQGNSIQSLLKHRAEELGKKINFSVSVMSFDGMRRMVEAGLGITILPIGSIKSLENSGCKIIRLQEEWAYRTLRLVVREEQSLPVVARNFLNYLASREVIDQTRLTIEHSL